MKRIKEIEERWKWVIGAHDLLHIVNEPMTAQYAREDMPYLLEKLKRAIEVIEHYSRCDGYCATDECVCHTKRAREFLKEERDE